MFWVGILSGCLIPSIPFSIFFLSIERLVIILFPFISNSNLWKKIIAITSALSISCLTIFYIILRISLVSMLDEKQG